MRLQSGDLYTTQHVSIYIDSNQEKDKKDATTPVSQQRSAGKKTKNLTREQTEAFADSFICSDAFV